MRHNMLVWWIYESQRQTVHHSQNKWNLTLVIQVQSNTRVQSLRWHGLHPQMEKKSFDAVACADAPAQSASLAGRSGTSLPGFAKQPTRDRKRPRGWCATPGGRVVSVGRRSVPPSVRASGALSALWTGSAAALLVSAIAGSGLHVTKAQMTLEVGRWGVANFYSTILLFSSAGMDILQRPHVRAYSVNLTWLELVWTDLNPCLKIILTHHKYFIRLNPV
jgi:hypothetical protein